MRFLMLDLGDPGSPTAVAIEPFGDGDPGRTRTTSEPAGVVLAAEALHPSPTARRLRVDRRASAPVLDGPFDDPTELVGPRRPPDPGRFAARPTRSPGRAMSGRPRARPDRERAELEIHEIDEATDRVIDRDPRRDRGGLADRIRPADRRARADRPRRRARRGARPGRAGRGARAVAGRPGIPRNPGAWLMATAKHRAIDLLRRQDRARRKHERDRARPRESQQAMALAAFETPRATTTSATTSCASSSRPATRSCRREARVALTLRLLGGLTTDEIARAFLVPESTIAQRIVRAKRTLTEAHVPFEVPRADELAARLASVLEVVYLIFNEGYSATAGRRLDAARPVRRGAPARADAGRARPRPSPRSTGSSALMEIQASRSGARIGPDGRADPAPRPGPAAAGTSS